MNKQIKPIETFYAGCNFRSRLEARWAVFFDALGVIWRYEPEGYVLPSGVCYLPDFYFPTYKCYGEVKPEGFDSDSRHEEFVANGGECLLLFKGVPGQYPNEIFEKTESGIWYQDGYAFADIVWGEKYGLFFCGPHSLPETADQMPEFMYATNMANTIRFEYGTPPRVKSFHKIRSEEQEYDWLREEFNKWGNINAYRALK